MNKFIALTICTMLFLFSKANFYAVEKCPELNHMEFQQACKNNNYALVDMKHEGFYLIEAEDFDLEDQVCFSTKVNYLDRHFAFNTSTLLLRLKAGNANAKLAFIEENALVSHPIIPNLYLLKSDSKKDIDLANIKAILEQNQLVEYVGYKQVFTLQAATNDPLYNLQWSIENDGTSQQGSGTPNADMQVDSAWTISQGSNAIKIAILDSGVDTAHEDLLTNLLPGFDSYATDSTDTKGFPTPNFSSDGHGTACAGIVAAEADNNLGVAGIANLCKIIPVRIFYYQNYGGSIGVQATTNTDALISGSAYAWRIANADVMSTSAGLSPLFISALGVDPVLMNVEINEAYWSGRSGYGVPMFFSAGNDDFNDVLWPGDLPTTISVGASSMCDERKNPNDCSVESWGSSYGVMLDIVAPGTRIATTDMTGSNGYSTGKYTATFNGTSASCPNAAGVGALILSYSPGLHARDVKAILNITADRVGGYGYDSTTIHGTWDLEMGHGRINAYKAIQLAETYESTVGVGIKDIIEETSFTAHPNPSAGKFTITTDNAEIRSFSMYDLLGKEVNRFEPTNGLNDIEVDLPTGVYFLKAFPSGESLKITIAK